MEVYFDRRNAPLCPHNISSGGGDGDDNRLEHSLLAADEENVALLLLWLFRAKNISVNRSTSRC